MRTKDVISHYGNAGRASKALGLSHAAVYRWGEYPPAIRQLQVERATNGKLRAEPEIKLSVAEPLKPSAEIQQAKQI